MPHQLRRIIAINILNPITGTPSGRISELDPRGGVLTVGANGVGKTSFLRLIPLFYGATPSMVLKGTGRQSMIKHTLPDPSSAVAYEYERESDGHLRTAVMFAKEGEDTPEFHIITGGFDETFFYDENNQFLSRKEFLLRTRARNVSVTPVLQLSEYRSVILNERLSTKNAKELMALAREHSLGPRPLRNLNRISAAMANEKIEFRDLKNIVLEHVAENQAIDSKRQNVRELKQRKEDVNAWLERRKHMAELQKRKPDADRMKQRIDSIKGLHLEMCSLHVAVKAALSQVRADHARLLNDRDTQAKTFDDALSELEASIGEASKSKAEAFELWSGLHGVVTAVERRQNHFERINAQELADAQSREGGLKQQRKDKEDALQALTEAVGSLKAHHEGRVQGIARSAQEQRAEIAQRMLAVKEGRAAKVERLSQEKDDALRSRQPPPRLSEIAQERNRMAVREGEITQLIRNPVATPEALEAQEVARAVFEQRQQELDDARDAANAAERTVNDARTHADESVQAVQGLERALQDLMRSIDNHTSQLTPAPGSLLAFIRESDEPQWVHASKLIHESLIHRSDLAPEFLDPAEAPGGAGADGRVVIGPASLQVGELEAPAWFSMHEVRQQLEEAQARAVQINEQAAKARAQAERAGDSLRQAGTDHERAKALLGLAVTGLRAARDDKERMERQVKEEQGAAAGKAREALAQLKASVDALAKEEKSLQEAFAKEAEAIHREFQAQREALDKEVQRQKEALDDELSAVEQRSAAELAQEQEDYERRLKGEGLDPERIKRVEGELASLGAQLASIAANRHEVEAFGIFRENELPHLETNRREVLRLKGEADDAARQHGTLVSERDRLSKEAANILADVDARLKSLVADEGRLAQLREQKLKDFLDHVAASAYTGRPLHEIEEAIANKLKALEDEDSTLRREILSLNNEFEKREGGPQDWLKLKRAELPDRQTRLEHEYRCLEAQQLCDWFERSESGSYIDQLHSEMSGFFENASAFVSRLDSFDRLVQAFNTELGRALATAKDFERFKDLGVRVTSSVGQQEFLRVLRQMKDRSGTVSLMGRTFARVGMELPTEEDAALVREYREILQGDGGVMVNLSEQVCLECTLYENGRRRTITNEEEFRAVSSNGNSALITAMFLMGFVQMIRGSAPVRLVWVSDEIGRFDEGNLGAFLNTLALNNIDVISASPSVDPALARHFPRLSMFDGTGAIFTTEKHEQEMTHEFA